MQGTSVSSQSVTEWVIDSYCSFTLSKFLHLLHHFSSLDHSQNHHHLHCFQGQARHATNPDFLAFFHAKVCCFHILTMQHECSVEVLSKGSSASVNSKSTEFESNIVETLRIMLAVLARTGLVQWLRWTCDWKVVGLSSCRNGGIIFFSRVNFFLLTLNLISVSIPHPCYRTSM